jgi:hypothetical protein|tara:strand:+ start:274 stop:519 length:246 start_codon:yes stop_codon:yes gene_type:complete
MMLADGFEKAFMGIAHRAGQEDVVAYDFDKCVGVLIDRDNMEPDEAHEFMWFNVVGAYVGDKTPVFIKHMSNIEELYDEEL